MRFPSIPTPWTETDAGVLFSHVHGVRVRVTRLLVVLMGVSFILMMILMRFRIMSMAFLFKRFIMIFLMRRRFIMMMMAHPCVLLSGSDPGVNAQGKHRSKDYPARPERLETA